MACDTLLIEIGTEELPPRHVGSLSQYFAQSLATALTALGFTFEKFEYFSTPRRLAVRFFSIPFMQPSRRLKKRGPTLASTYDLKGNPSSDLLGFARSVKAEIADLQVYETLHGSWLVYEYVENGRSLIELLPALIEKGLNNIPASKRMRWGNDLVTFLRPIRWICIVYGAQPVPITVFGLTATSNTHGHRFHAPQPLNIPHADNYLSVLKEAKVIAHEGQRRELITQAIQKLAKINNGTAIIEEKFLDEVTGLVEWPVPLYAHFDRAFLDMPKEVLISSLQKRQKCFPLQNIQGKLLPTFILISNTDAMPNANRIISGNESILHARLRNAQFFYDQDRKIPLILRLEALKNIIFQKRLGSLYDKSQRIAKLAGQIAKQINTNSHLSERAGKLCKADLLTKMVGEFPELRGIMGSYYARHDEEPFEVAQAIYESYLPRFSKDNVPLSPIGMCVALADRLDTLMGIFSIGLIPLSKKDPYALRRKALGILRILIERKVPLDLENLCQWARHGYGNLIDEETVPRVVDFCVTRLKAWFVEQGYNHQCIEAVMAHHPTLPFDCSLRIAALTHFQTLPQAQDLTVAHKRVRHFLQKNSSFFNAQQLPAVSASLLNENAEKMLCEEMEQIKAQIGPLLVARKYPEVLMLLSRIQKPLSRFFLEVIVMTDDRKLRQNRINLLCQLFALFMHIADLSKLTL